MSAPQIGKSNANAVSTLRGLRSDAVRLPDASDTWASIEYDISKRAIQKFKQAGVVERAGFEKAPINPDDPSAGTYERNVYRTDADAYEWIQANLSEVPECPAPDCHATGIHNPAGVDGYRCSNDECDRELTREEAERLIR